MPRRLLALLLLALVAGGCGEDEQESERPAAGRDAPVPRLSLSEAQTLVERAQVALVREASAGRAPIATEIEPEPTSSRRLVAQNGKEFDLLVFATPDAARTAWSSVHETEVIADGGAAMRAVNVLAVFPEPAEDGVYRRVKQALRDVAVACGERGGDAELRGLCFEDVAAVPPPGEGTASDELAPIGADVTVGGVRYTVSTARQLNPRIAPGEDLVGGRLPGRDALFFAVFLRACNDGHRPARTTDRLAVVSAFGGRSTPVDLPSDNPFAYEPVRLDPDDCLPQAGSVADRTADGALVLFELPEDRLDDRPLGLEIVGPDGTERATIELDL